MKSPEALRAPIAFARFLCLCAALFSALLFAEESQKSLPPITVYATQMAQPNTNTSFVLETHKAIAKAFEPRRVTFEMVPISELDQIVKERRANIVMAGAGFYRRHLRDGLRDVATMVSPLQPNPDKAVGSVIVTLKDRSDIQTLADLRGKTVSANAPTGFQGIMIIRNELLLEGFDPEKFFRRVTYVGMDLLPAIDLLERGSVDAAILTSCLMEESRARGMNWMDHVKPIGIRRQNDIDCRVSSRLYPNWSVMITPTLDATTTRRIVAAIHAMPPSSDGVEWAVASDFGPVDEMYRNLKLGPYEHLRLWTVKRVFTEYGPWVAAGVFLVVLLIPYSLLLSHLVKKRTALLADSLSRQKEQSETIVRLTERYETVRRAAEVAQISSIIAHELSQPLGGILLYAQGLKNIAAASSIKPDANGSEILGCTEKIITRAEKANSIVKSVRDRAKNKKSPRSLIDLRQVVSEAKQDFLLTEKSASMRIDAKVPALPCPMVGSAFDIKLALQNLLRNSVQALSGVRNPWINMELSVTGDGDYLIAVLDNGEEIPSGLLERLNAPLESLKDDGLGLGLSIVQSIVGAHYGKLTFGLGPRGGLAVRILLPAAKEQDVPAPLKRSGPAGNN